MKNLKTVALKLFLVVFIFLLVGCSVAAPVSTPISEFSSNLTPTQSSTQPSTMTFKANISLSEEIGDPPVSNSIKTIELKFSEPLDPSTASENVALFILDGAGKAIEQPIYIRIDPDKPDLLLINTNPVLEFPEGQEFQLVIGTALKAASGHSMEKEYSGYFATNSTFSLTNAAKENIPRTQIVVISDIHLGIDDRFAEINKNRQPLVDFLTALKNSPEVKELVIAGDLIDTWFLPMDYEIPQPESTFVDQIAANNQMIVDAVNAIIQADEIKVTYVPGNHDITVTEADIDRIFPGINQARDSVQGLGEYVSGVNSEIVIEHGHKYNFFVAPDPISNRDITNNGTSILPPGYFFTRIATSSVVEGRPLTGNTFPEITVDKEDVSQYQTYLYFMIWKAILSDFPVSESFSDQVIKTNIDGFTQTYAINDLIPQVDPTTGKLDSVLFKGIAETWDARQTANGVQAKLSVEEAIAGAASVGETDIQAKLQYFDLDASKRIVVFGHTHAARIIPFSNLIGQKTIYVNSGTWVDLSRGYPGMTFVVITENTSESALTFVNLYQYTGASRVTQWEDAQAIIAR